MTRGVEQLSSKPNIAQARICIPTEKPRHRQCNPALYSWRLPQPRGPKKKSRIIWSSSQKLLLGPQRSTHAERRIEISRTNRLRRQGCPCKLLMLMSFFGPL